MITMESCIPPHSSYLLMSQSQDRLGWDCFVEGLITVLFLECICRLFLQCTPQKSLEKWGVSFLKSLLNLTHKQWIFRNAGVHHKIDGLTQEQHMEVLSCIQTLIETTPLDLLPCHCHLLDKKIYDLGNVETIQRQLGLLLWNQHSALPPMFPPDTLHQAACQFSIHGSSVRTHEDLSIITPKPLLGPGPILHAVPVNRLSRRHFRSLVDHNQLV